MRRLGKVSVALVAVQVLGGTLLPYFFKDHLNRVGTGDSDQI